MLLQTTPSNHHLSEYRWCRSLSVPFAEVYNITLCMDEATAYLTSDQWCILKSCFGKQPGSCCLIHFFQTCVTPVFSFTRQLLSFSVALLSCSKHTPPIKFYNWSSPMSGTFRIDTKNQHLIGRCKYIISCSNWLYKLSQPPFPNQIGWLTYLDVCLSPRQRSQKRTLLLATVPLQLD